MTDQEINEAIARQMDFYIIQDGDAFSLRHGRETTLYPWYRTPEEAWCDAPEYITDRNAMDEVKATLDQETGTMQERLSFAQELEKIVCDRPPMSREALIWCVSNARPRQEAKAFLRVHGKWKE